MVMRTLRKALPLLVGGLPLSPGVSVPPTEVAHVWTRIRGWGAGTFRADVWCSKDGRTWSQVNAGVIPARMAPGVLAFEGKIWVFGGSAAGVAGDDTWLNDVWTLSPGKRWVRETARAPWSRRAPQYLAVFRERVWLYGGKGIEANGNGGFADDVWTFGSVQRGDSRP